MSSAGAHLMKKKPTLPFQNGGTLMDSIKNPFLLGRVPQDF